MTGFLARYSGATRASYATDLRQFFAWCAQRDLEVFAAKRGHIALYARTMEAPAARCCWDATGIG